MKYQLIHLSRRAIFWMVIVTSFFCLAITSGFAWIFGTRQVYPADKCAFLGVVFGLPIIYWLAQLVVSTTIVCTIASLVATMMLATVLYVWNLARMDN